MAPSITMFLFHRCIFLLGSISPAVWLPQQPLTELLQMPKKCFSPLQVAQYQVVFFLQYLHLVSVKFFLPFGLSGILTMRCLAFGPPPRPNKDFGSFATQFAL